MATANYVDQITVVEAAWLNDVDYLTYIVFAAFNSDGAVGADGTILVSDGTTYVKESGNTARTSLGLGTADSPTFNGLTVTTSANIDGGTIDNTVIGGDTAAAGDFTDITATGTVDFSGATSVLMAATLGSHLVPTTDDTYDLGSASAEWRNLYIDGTANIDSLVADAATINGVNPLIHWFEFELVQPGTDCAAATDITTFTMPFDGTFLQDDTDLYQLAAVVDTAGTTGTMTVDIHLNGTTIMTTNKLDIETGETSTATATTQPDLTTTTFSAGDKITFDIDAVHTTAAKGCRVIFSAARTSDG